MAYRKSIAGRIQRVFLLFTLIVGILFSALILGYSWVIEDNVFNRLVEREADFIVEHFYQTGTVAEPRLPFMTLYPSWEVMPASIPQQHRADPNRIEFGNGRGGTIHTRVMTLGSDEVVLAADVSAYEVSRDYLPTVSLWLILGVAVVGGVAAWSAWYFARSELEPLNRLAAAVSQIRPGTISPGFSEAYPNNEVGFLAETIEKAITDLQSVLEREKDFTRDVGHELRTPIAILTLLGNQLEKEANLSPENQTLFKNTTMELNLTISTLLALAREENTPIREVAILPILEDCIIQHFQLARNPDFKLDIQVPIQMKAHCNPHLAGILFNNLLTNAIHYASEPGLRITAKQDRLIFENAVDPTNVISSKGLGLGLNLVKRICARFNWQPTIESEATIFRITIITKQAG